MKRRDFLKILSTAPLVAAVPALAKTDETTSVILDWTDEIKLDVETAEDKYNRLIAQLRDAELVKSHPPTYLDEKVGVSYWKSEWGNTRHTATGTYEAGDIVVGTDGKKYRAIATK